MEWQRLQEREWESHRRSERQETRKRGRGRSESRLMWKCLRSPRASPPPPRSLALYLFHSFFHSHWHSSLGASLHSDVPFRSAITAEMRQLWPTQVRTQVHGASASLNRNSDAHIRGRRHKRTQWHTAEAFEWTLLAGHNEGILQKRSWDGSHRQDTHREKEHFFLSSPLLLLPTSSLMTLDFVPCDLQHINATGKQFLDF